MANIAAEDRAAAVSPPVQPSSTAARTTGMAYTTPDDLPVSQSRSPAATKTGAISSRRGPGFIVIFSAKSVKVLVVQVSTLMINTNVDAGNRARGAAGDFVGERPQIIQKALLRAFPQD